MSRVRAALPLVVWVLALGAAVAGLHVLPWSPRVGFGSDPALATVGVLRLVALGCGWYLLAVTVAGGLLRLVGAARAATAVEAWAPGVVGRLLRRAAVAVAAASVVGAVPAGATAPRDEPVTMSRWSEEPAAAAIGEDDDGPPVLRRLRDDAAGTPRPAPVPDATPPAGVHVVRPGDHLWAIAEAALTAARQRPVRDVEVAPFWRSVVAANAGVLADPDLVFPGQIVRVPPVPDIAGEV